MVVRFINCDAWLGYFSTRHIAAPGLRRDVSIKFIPVDHYKSSHCHLFAGFREIYGKRKIAVRRIELSGRTSCTRRIKVGTIGLVQLLLSILAPTSFVQMWSPCSSNPDNILNETCCLTRRLLSLCFLGGFKSSTNIFIYDNFTTIVIADPTPAIVKITIFFFYLCARRQTRVNLDYVRLWNKSVAGVY